MCAGRVRVVSGSSIARRGNRGSRRSGASPCPWGPSSGPHGDLGSGSRRGGDAGQSCELQRPSRGAVFPGHAVQALQLVDCPAMGEHGIGELRRVHHRATVESQERVRVRVRSMRGCDALIYDLYGRVLGNLVKTPVNASPPSESPLPTLSGRLVARSPWSVTRSTRPAPPSRIRTRRSPAAPTQRSPGGRGMLEEILEAGRPAAARCGGPLH